MRLEEFGVFGVGDMLNKFYRTVRFWQSNICKAMYLIIRIFSCSVAAD